MISIQFQTSTVFRIKLYGLRLSCYICI